MSKKQPALEQAHVPTRREIRTFLRIRKTRVDGSPWTQPSLDARRELRRRRNRCVRVARKANR